MVFVRHDHTNKDLVNNIASITLSYVQLISFILLVLITIINRSIKINHYKDLNMQTIVYRDVHKMSSHLCIKYTVVIMNRL